MGIQNFPVTLQPIIHQGFLAREFEQAIRSRLGYRACADREAIAVGNGETLTKTGGGLKPSVTIPIPGSFNTSRSTATCIYGSDYCNRLRGWISWYSIPR